MNLRPSVLALFVFVSFLLLSTTHAQDRLPMSPEQRQEIDLFFELRAQANEAFQKEREKLGQEAFLESIDKNQQRFDSELGQVRLTLIDNQIIEKVVPSHSEKAYVIVDKNKVDHLSEHLLKIYVPRQHIDGGSSRTDGERGRDVVLVWTDGNKKVDHYDEYKRPKMWSLDWWKTYAKATYKKPKKNDVYFGLFSASVQVAFAAGISGANILLDPSKSFNYMPLAMNALFGSVIGVYSQTYVNWVYRGGTKADSPTKIRMKQIAKSSVVSALYAYTLVMATQGGFESMSFLTLSGIQNHLHVWSNMFFNNMAKVEFAQWAKVLEKKRADTKELEIRIPFTETVWKTGFKKRQMNYQIYSYTPVNALRTADLIGVSFAGVPIGKLMLWFSVPFTKYATMKWAEKYHPEQAKELRLREDWERMVRGARTVTDTTGLALFGTPMGQLLEASSLSLKDQYRKLRKGGNSLPAMSCQKALARLAR